MQYCGENMIVVSKYLVGVVKNLVDIDMVIFENNDIDIVIDMVIFENIDIDKGHSWKYRYWYR